MHPFILSKSIRTPGGFIPTIWLFSLLALAGFNLILTPDSQAQNVQRWQDQSGQWHFGDQAAAKDQHSQDVIIKNPISIINNEQSAKAVQPTSNAKGRSDPNPSRTASSSKANRTLPLTSTADCAKLREQLHQPNTASRKKQPTRQELIDYYERTCIMNRYYGE